MSYNQSAVSPETLRRAVDLFYAGHSIEVLADDLGVTRGVLSGKFSRGAIVRQLGGEPARQFDKRDSLTFRKAMEAGLNYREAGAVVGKTESASRRHAVVLGLVADESVMVGGGVETIRPMAAEGGDMRASMGAVSQDHDAAHVAACLAQGGFERYDFASGWTVGPDGGKRWPFTGAAIEVAKAQVAAIEGRAA